MLRQSKYIYVPLLYSKPKSRIEDKYAADRNDDVTALIMIPTQICTGRPIQGSHTCIRDQCLIIILSRGSTVYIPDKGHCWRQDNPTVRVYAAIRYLLKANSGDKSLQGQTVNQS